AFGVAALCAQIMLTMAGDLSLVETRAELCQLADALRPFRHNRAHDRFVTKPCTGLKRVTHVQLKRIFVAGHARDSALRPRGVCLGGVAFRDDRYRAVLCRFQCKAETGDTAAYHDTRVFFQSSKAGNLACRR